MTQWCCVIEAGVVRSVVEVTFDKQEKAKYFKTGFVSTSKNFKENFYGCFAEDGVNTREPYSNRGGVFFNRYIAYLKLNNIKYGDIKAHVMTREMFESKLRKIDEEGSEESQ